MGLSSSQARLIHLTTRMHQIEYKAQRIEAQKLQLANDSDKVYQTYLEELEATKIQYKALQEDGSITFHDATLSKLQELGYRFQIIGLPGFLVTHDDVAMYNLATNSGADMEGGNEDYFVALKTGRIGHTAVTEEVDPNDPEKKVYNTTSDRVNKNDGFTEIYTLDQLKEMTGSGTYRLMNDFELDAPLTARTFENGKIDGNGHTITLNCDNALFSEANGATVSNLNIINNRCKDKGIFANFVNGGSYENISVSGNVHHDANGYADRIVGGFAGKIYNDAAVKNCSTNVNVYGTAHVGGFAGQIEGCQTIENCVANGAVYAQVVDTGRTDDGHAIYEVYSGGFVGDTAGSTFKNSVSNCSLTINDPNDLTNKYTNLDSGGFAGATANVTMEYCASNGTITSNVTASDYDQNTYNEVHYSKTIGSLVGSLAPDSTTTINNCNANSSIISITDAISGFVGYLNPNSILNSSGCNATGNLSTNAKHMTDNADRTPRYLEEEANAGCIYTLDPAATVNINNFYNGTGKEDVRTVNVGVTYNITTTNTPNQNSIYAKGAHTSINERLEGPEVNAAREMFKEIASGNYFFEEDAKDFYLKDHWDDPVWLTNMINEGFLYLYKVDDKNGESYQVSVSTDTGLKEVQDEINLKKAEAKYEADMRRIDMKDRKYDSDLAALDAERNATKDEMETLKTVAKDNVDRTFKLFS